MNSSFPNCQINLFKVSLALLSLITLFLTSFTTNAQKNIELLVLKKVNQLRDSLELNPLSLDPILCKAGEDHAYYMAAKTKLTHFQKTFSKETPQARVEYYKGNRTYVGENVAFVPAKKLTPTVLDEEMIAESLYNSWLNSPPHYTNMIHPDYTLMGLAYYTTATRVYAAQVFSSNEIKLPKAFRNTDFSWGVRPAEYTCKDEPQTYETMFFANGVQIVGRDIYFYFHDRNFFNKVIQEDNDGIAVDIVLREQLPCNRENQFHISEVYDGEMQQPVYKNDLIRNNTSKNSKKIKVKIGKVPSYLNNQQWDANIIIINNNNLCDYSYPVEVPHDIFPLLDLNPYYDHNDKKIKENQFISIAVSDTIHVELFYERSQKKYTAMDTRAFFNLLSWGDRINDVEVDCFASVEGKSWYNQQLLTEREKSVYQLLTEYEVDSSKISISSDENWELMQHQIEFEQLNQLQGKTKKEVKAFLKKNKTPYIDSLLFEQRKTHIRTTVDTVLKVKDYNDYLLASYYDSSISFKSLPWNKILREDYILRKLNLSTEIIKSLKDEKKVKTNLMGAASIGNTNAFIDSALVEYITNDIDTSNSKLLFNTAHFLTKYWFTKYARYFETSKIANTITPNDLRNLIQKIDTHQIALKDLERLKVNLLLSGIHYYVSNNNWTMVRSYFDEIASLVKLNNFTPVEAKELALFCNHFHKFKTAVKILVPFFENHLLTENGYFVLAQTSTLIQDQLKKTDYHNYMEAAKEANHVRYCEWLDSSFQIQRDEYIKKDFCNSCN